jgi:hypothetical protein
MNGGLMPLAVTISANKSSTSCRPESYLSGRAEDHVPFEAAPGDGFQYRRPGAGMVCTDLWEPGGEAPPGHPTSQQHEHPAQAPTTAFWHPTGHAAAVCSAVTTCTTRVPSSSNSTPRTATPDSPSRTVVPCHAPRPVTLSRCSRTQRESGGHGPLHRRRADQTCPIKVGEPVSPGGPALPPGRAGHGARRWYGWRPAEQARRVRTGYICPTVPSPARREVRKGRRLLR